jgi:CDP-diacylglycerol--glycerol-3-phosphate 3-phosphatidyltransferase
LIGDENVPLGDRKNMCYMGSTVVYGRGKAVVVGIGMNTEMGKIADALTQTVEEQTPLQRRLADLSKILTWLVLGISVLIFAVEVVRSFVGGGTPAFTDYLDGHIARKQGIVTDFGKFIDPVADKLLNLSAMIMLTYCGLLPQWAVIVILARELAVDGLRMVAVGQGRVIAAGKLGKIKTVSQIVLVLYLMIAGRLAPVIFGSIPVILTIVNVIGWIITLWVVAITVWSGVDYFTKNFDCIRNAK